MTDKNKTDSSNTLQPISGSTEYSDQPPSVAAASSNRKFLSGLSTTHWVYLYLICAATLVTWLASQNVAHFKILGSVAFQSGFPGDLDQWTRRGGWENIEFDTDRIKVDRTVDKSSYAVRTFPLSPSQNRSQEKLIVSGQVNTIMKGPTTDGGALMVWLQDDTEKIVKYLVIGKLDGPAENKEVNRVVNLTDNVTRFSLVLTNRKSHAEFELLDATIMLVTEQPRFLQVRAAVFITWTILLLIALYYLYRHASATMFAVIAGVISLTFVGVLMPETVRYGAIKPILVVVQNVTGLTSQDFFVYAYKVGHFVFFFLSTFILLLYRKKLRLPAWEIYFLMIVLAVATEGLQLYLSDRSTRFSDLVIDFSAVFAGGLLATIVTMLKDSRSNNADSPTTEQ